MESDSERVTLRLSVEDLQAIDMFVQAGEFANRSEVIRRALKDFIRSRAKEVAEGLAARKDLQNTLLELANLRSQIETQRETLGRLLQK